MSSVSDIQPPSDVMEALMDPVKREILLRLLEKGGLEAYKRREKAKPATPLKNFQNVHCESPTALQRRRALQKLNQGKTSESSSSEQSDVVTEIQGRKVPFEELLKGVRAFVEVQRDGTDRSDGIKVVMKAMGATVRNEFSRDVTHVVFKDGSYTTYQKAKLLKVHLVSVLWVDAVRRNNARVPEKNYPAFGDSVCDKNVSILCSQLQKDYEEIIRDERRRSTSVLPEQFPKVADKSRRCTIMTPQTSITSYVTAQNRIFPDDDHEDDTDVSDDLPPSPQLTSDDSDCAVVDGHIGKRSKNYDLLQPSPVFTEDGSDHAKEKDHSSVVPATPSKQDISSESTNSKSLLSRVTLRKKRNTINVLTSMVLTPNVDDRDSLKVRKVPSLRSSSLADCSKNELTTGRSPDNTMPSLRVSSSSERTKTGFVDSKSKTKAVASVRLTDCTKSGLVNSKEAESFSKRILRDSSMRSNTMSSLRVSSGSDRTKSGLAESKSGNRENSIITIGSTMSSLRLSDTSKNAENEKITNTSKDLNQTRNKLTLRSSSVASVRSEIRIEGTTDLNSRASSVNSLRLESVNRRNYKSTMENGKDLSVTPQQAESQNRTTNKVRRASSVVSRVEAEDNRQGSTSKGIDSLMMLEPERPKVNGAISPKRHKRASSVASSTSRKSSNLLVTSPNLRRSRRLSVSSENLNNSVARQQRLDSVSLFSEDEIDDRSSSGSRHRAQITPSPQKKSRVDITKSASKRKLYNPTDVYIPPSQDDHEREEYVKQKSKKSPDGFIVPNNAYVKLIALSRKPTNSELERSEVEDPNQFDKSPKKKKITKREKKKRDKTPVRNSSADEQRDLLKLLSEKVSPEISVKRSQRISLSQTIPRYKFPSEFSSSSSSSSVLPISPVKRRSTLDFMTVSQARQNLKLKLDPKKKTSIVCTKFHRREVQHFETVVRKLGTFVTEDKVTDKTTHLVLGEEKRTINMLRAIARGCWILQREWLLKSEEKGKWLDEEDYEATEFSPAVQQCRLQRQAFGPKYSMDIFNNCGQVYVAKSTIPKPADLRELITTCKGAVTTIFRNAEIVVGDYLNRDSVVCVTEKWVLDSISDNKLKSFRAYLIRSTGHSSPNF